MGFCVVKFNLLNVVVHLILQLHDNLVIARIKCIKYHSLFLFSRYFKSHRSQIFFFSFQKLATTYPMYIEQNRPRKVTVPGHMVQWQSPATHYRQNQTAYVARRTATKFWTILHSYSKFNTKQVYVISSKAVIQDYLFGISLNGTCWTMFSRIVLQNTFSLMGKNSITLLF